MDIIGYYFHKYGGLFDLDILPKLKKLKQGDLIVARPQTNKNKKYEMEVLWYQETYIIRLFKCQKQIKLKKNVTTMEM